MVPGLMFARMGQAAALGMRIEKSRHFSGRRFSFSLLSDKKIS